jgi:hypothetical protein
VRLEQIDSELLDLTDVRKELAISSRVTRFAMTSLHVYSTV